MKQITLLLSVLITQSTVFTAPLHAATNMISPGEILCGRITAPAQTNFYSFAATSNDVIFITLLVTNGPGTYPYFYLYDPDGNVVADPPYNSYVADLANFRLTKTGTYTIGVIDNGLNEDFDYNICMIKIPGPNFPEPGEGTELILLGETRAARITPGDLDAYAFPVIAGDDVVVTLSKASGAGVPVLYLYGPDGVLLASDSRPAGAEVHIRCSPQFGTFTIVCLESALYRAFTYNLSLVQTPGPPPSYDPARPYVAEFRCETNVVTRWPTNAAGFELQFCNDLSATNVNGQCFGSWTNVPPPYSVIGDHYFVTNRSPDLIRFYRLARP